tara:strand:- start:441 stop:884 length:444 start_codon:yes stop_codon:yes gene_type:complete
MKKNVIIGIIIAVVVVVGMAIYFYPASKSGCAKEGEQYSKVFTDEYPENCCEGLTEYEFGMDTSFSVADKCYETGQLSGLPVGICISCGDGRCRGVGEEVCSCPEDCVGRGKSGYNTIQEFCDEGYEKFCPEDTPEVENSELCALCS